MGSTELTLVFRYGIPLAIKLLADGKSEAEIEKAVSATITGIYVANAGELDVVAALAEADEKQADGIVDGLFGVITGAAGAVVGLIKAFCGLLGGK